MSRMLTLLLLSTLFAASISQRNCAYGTIQLPQDPQCALVRHEENDYTTAETACQDMGGHLISIHNGFANHALMAYATNEKGATELYIGGNNHKNGVWSWVDGTTMNYTNWAPGQPKEKGGCIIMKLEDGKWHNTDCKRTMPYVCEMPEESVSACPSSSWVEFQGFCYRMEYTEDMAFWKDAEYNCGERGAHLTSIHSEEENSFLMDLCLSLDHSGESFFPWIGLYWNGTLQWTDGSPVTYSSLQHVAPYHNNPAIFALAFDDGGNTGLWDDYGYTMAGGSYTYVCKRPIATALTAVTTKSVRSLLNREMNL